MENKKRKTIDLSKITDWTNTFGMGKATPKFKRSITGQISSALKRYSSIYQKGKPTKEHMNLRGFLTGMPGK